MVPLQTYLSPAQREAYDIRASLVDAGFAGTRREIAARLVNKRTGKPLQPSAIKQRFHGARKRLKPYCELRWNPAPARRRVWAVSYSETFEDE